MATTWRNRLLPTGAEPAQRAALLGVQNWLRDHFSENTRYDSIVADLNELITPVAEIIILYL